MGIFKKLSKQTKAPKPPGAARTDPPKTSYAAQTSYTSVQLELLETVL
jgi:hypothetical protein